MKKSMNFPALLCALALMLTALTGCGGDQPAASSGNQSATSSGEQTEGQHEAVSAYTATYDEVVALLAAEGVATDAPVDMNTTAGYWNDNANGGLTAEAVVACDIARDFGGVYLVWYDIDGAYAGDWKRMKINGGVMLYQGGMYTLQLDSYRGMFGLGFSPDASEELKTQARAAFDRLDTTLPQDIRYMTSASELALALKAQGLVDMAAIGAMEDLNSKYVVEGPGEVWDEAAGDYVQVEDCQYFAEFASEAQTFDGITIFYYDLSDSYTFAEENLEYSGVGLAYRGLLADNRVVGYVGDADYNYTPYTENGQEISYTVDLICGNFAVSMDDSVANKTEIIDYLNTLAK